DLQKLGGRGRAGRGRTHPLTAGLPPVNGSTRAGGEKWTLRRPPTRAGASKARRTSATTRRRPRPGRGSRLMSAGTCRAASRGAARAGPSAERLPSRPVRTARSAANAGESMELTVVKNATCTFCGCVCDDIELHADGERITHTKAACVLGVSWFKNHTAERLYPDALIDGKPATVDEAVGAAAEYLYKADLPLVYGLSNVTCEAQRESVALAELIGGVIDSHTSL